MKSIFFRVVVIALLLAGCSQPVPQPTASPAPEATQTQAPTVTPTLTPEPSATPDPYSKYTINYLRSRKYGGGEIQVDEKAGQNSAFARYLIHYPSDGLTIHGFMDVPNGKGNFPVIIALHGYIAPSIYNTLDYTTRYADALASAGYFVLHPNLRSFPPSDSGDDLFRVGMATDVLNLIAILKEMGGHAGPLQTADREHIGMWGHSMGGGVTTRVITVSSDIKAAVLYSAVSGDEQKNYEAIGAWSNSQRGQDERAVATEELSLISPMYFYDKIQAAVSINHGLADSLVPVQWSVETCNELKNLGKTVECHYYDGQPHTFEGEGDKEFIQNTIQFFDRYLHAP